ncbi:hypothetical protein [Streptomyces alkaliphilus]|nr:hypothetical protein [Streptomyces alkaliphilus]
MPADLEDLAVAPGPQGVVGSAGSEVVGPVIVTPFVAPQLICDA